MDVIVTLTCDAPAAQKVGEQLSEQEMVYQSSPRGNLDGSVAEWVIIASVAIQSLPAILTSIKDLMGQNRVSSVKIRKLDNQSSDANEVDVEIKNPSKAEIQEILDTL
ncbi:hypothetical protein [Kocuria sp. UCD-OTCP]|uniref:hypothetical protein n=1 Tax=Kocuria sp. UCD-OTCP TaxID=1292021 RepID=UPI00123729CF|nr:hypothetical protein [Kocuria sp. UCD-OTCP]